MTDFDAAARTWDADPQKVQRAQRVAEAIAAAVPGLSRMQVLEYGSGTGLLGFALCSRAAAVTLADSSREMTAVAREKILALGAVNVRAVELDLTSGETPADRYDLVCTLLTLHHVPDTAAILRRFHDVLRPGGIVCVSDLDAEDGSFHGPGFTGHNGFRREDVAAQLHAAGFRDAAITTALEIDKQTAVGVRRFPVFLAVAHRDP